MMSAQTAETGEEGRRRGGSVGRGAQSTTTAAIPAVSRLGVWLLVWLGTCVTGCWGQPTRPLEYNLLEESRPGTTVGNVKRDSNLSFIYSEDDLFRMRFNLRPSPGSDHAALFEISESTGIIKTLKPIDREEECPYEDACVIELDITVTPLNYFRIIKVLVHLLDINDHSPTFPRSRTVLDVAETTGPGTVLATYSVEDLDSGSFGVQRFQFQYNLPKFDLRESRQADGSRDVSLVLKESLDRELDDYYTVTIIAWDGGMPQKTGSIVIDVSVTDSNDNNPKFENGTYETEVYENLPASSRILTVHAKDPDSGPNGVVVYEFAPHTVQEFGDIFALNNKTGEITVKGEVDYETTHAYHLTVMASDMGPNSLPAFAKVVVHVLDMNDHVPEIIVNAFNAKGQAQVPENSDIGHFVAHIQVTDEDSGHNGVFGCNIDNGLFNLEEIEGVGYKITTSRTFDREMDSEYLIVMRCKDQGEPPQTSSAQITVQITDKNDHDPIFPKKVFEISVHENNTVNAFIMKINASDKDSGKNAAIRYELEGLGDTGKDAVVMDPISGVIRANMIFDYEVRKHYAFRISAEDHGDKTRSATATLSLSIMDINDESPAFSQRSYSFTTTENIDPSKNREIGYVNATDRDGPKYNQVIYSLDPYQSDVDLFDIDRKTGRIFATQRLDREQKAKGHLVVVASNDGYPNIKSKADVNILISDVNDNAPTIDFPNAHNFTVMAPCDLRSGLLITQIKAHDPDTGNNSALVYSIANGNDDNIFGIDAQTGAIQVVQNGQAEDKKVKKLVIAVLDKGSPQQRSKSNLNILFNKTFHPYTEAQTGGVLLAGNNLIILIGVIAGAILVILIIVIAIFCVRSHQRRLKKSHMYNCRVQEQEKSLSNGSIHKDVVGSQLSFNSDTNSDKSIDNLNIGCKTKEKTKKEVTFSLDMDDPSYIDKIPANWPLQESKVIENPVAHHSERLTEPSGAPRGRSGPPPYPDRGRPAYPHHPNERVERLRHPPSRGHCQARGHHHHHHPDGAGPCRGPGGEKLTHDELEMHDMLGYGPNGDRDSESGCSGTDSGRGPSEEGDNFFYASQVDPFLPQESKNLSFQSSGGASDCSLTGNEAIPSPPAALTTPTVPNATVAPPPTGHQPPYRKRSLPRRQSRSPSPTMADGGLTESGLTESGPKSSSTSSLHNSTPLTAALHNTCKEQQHRMYPPGGKSHHPGYRYQGDYGHPYDNRPYCGPSLPRVPEHKLGKLSRSPSECAVLPRSSASNADLHHGSGSLSGGPKQRHSYDGYVPDSYDDGLRVADYPGGYQHGVSNYPRGNNMTSSDSNLAQAGQYGGHPYFYGPPRQGGQSRPSRRYHASEDDVTSVTDALSDDGTCTTLSGSYIVDHGTTDRLAGVNGTGRGDMGININHAPSDAFV